ncbi:protein MAIN-LIKE 1-like [Vicia villosa]|uniref:protein MAIN-LIKE 1-like n=1 Tax=Vicia villosa TaxID=3911 RepID=UPI00273CEEF5|nr:protein MAIN-LIKE 1-like [Vicia villosa]
MAFAERWNPETSSFHLSRGEVTITLDDVACLLRITIRGTLLGHSRLTEEEVSELLIKELGANPEDALEEVERFRGAHVRFHFLARHYMVELTAVLQAAGDPLEVEIQRERVPRCYFLFLLGTQLFMVTSSSYTHDVYLMYLLDTAHVHEYN